MTLLKRLFLFFLVMQRRGKKGAFSVYRPKLENLKITILWQYCDFPFLYFFPKVKNSYHVLRMIPKVTNWNAELVAVWLIFKAINNQKVYQVNEKNCQGLSFVENQDVYIYVSYFLCPNGKFLCLISWWKGEEIWKQELLILAFLRENCSCFVLLALSKPYNTFISPLWK